MTFNKMFCVTYSLTFSLTQRNLEKPISKGNKYTDKPPFIIDAFYIVIKVRLYYSYQSVIRDTRLGDHIVFDSWPTRQNILQ